MKKMIIAIFFLAALILIVAEFLYVGRDKIAKIAEIDGKKFALELALTPEQRQKGLGERDSLCQDCAMLFVFPREGTYSFWMKDMHFDLDIIWIAGGKIIHIARNVSCQSAEIMTPSEKADKVLEINSGLSDKYNFKSGDRVLIK